jgi:hypothetical protein
MNPEEYPLGPEEEAASQRRPAAAPPPPLMGVQPLPYARPMPQYVYTNTAFHQLAKASWVAPLIAMCLSCFAGAAARGNTDRMVSMILGFVYIVLILGGLVCGIIALCGVKRHGRTGILAPAIVGVVLNGVIVLAIVAMIPMVLTARSAVRSAGAASAARVPTPVSSPQSALRQAGWVGTAAGRNFKLGFVAMDSGHPDTLDFESNFNRRFSTLVLWADNRQNLREIRIDTDGASVLLANGGTVPALRTRDVLSTATRARSTWLGKYSSPIIVRPGEQVDGQFLFLPPEIDLNQIRTVYVMADGERMSVTGRVVTAQEKTQRMNQNAGK